MFNDLREYLDELEKRGWLRRVRTPLSPDLEIPEALRQVMRRRGPAVVFENVRGYEGWRVAGNIFANMEYVKLALGVKRLEEIGERLVKIVWRPPAISLGEKIRAFREALDLSRYTPRLVSKAPFLENIVEKPDLVKLLPAFRQYPLEPAPYLTYPLVIIRHPETGVTTMSVYRVMLRGGNELVLHWQMHKRGRLAYEEWVSRSEEPSFAIAIGCDPATLLAGAMPVPYPMDKLLFTGVLRGEGLKLYRLESGIMVPACAEVVIEGRVTRRLVEEGPFGDHWGYYDKPRRKFPLAVAERVYLRRNPIYYGTVVGKPPLEDSVIGKAVERVFLPILRTIMPEIVDVNLPEYGVFQGIAIVSIRKMYPGHAKKVMLGLWGLGMLSLTKIIVVVDHDVDVHDINQVIWAIASNVNPQRDVLVIPYTHTDELDPATPTPGYGSKLGIDATRKLPEEHGGEWPLEVSVPKELAEKVKRVLEAEGLLKER